MHTTKDFSIDLLNQLANSLIERDALKEIFFSSKEIELVENWIKEVLKSESPD